ncbi:hypothetical protein NLM27_24790 [Bradyrhizobium sp. CCGB12]|uniref:hypothetical protein n=1 Tax=Bradyrhizobium sp. CCGB12 TaxID=2949632 RepID=UPI0020B23029|nr:hypothetical protein [Bradyrhizobium sp. CCGB12]MCP3392015.1 hypothetical protein [Bradyrhizobium sp. CCGB12]
MRAGFFICIFLVAISIFGKSASAQSCDGLMRPIAMFSCFDAEIAALKEEESRLYAAQLESLAGPERSSLTREHNRWAGGLEAKCAIPDIGFLLPKDALVARSCLLDQYRDRFAQLTTVKTATLSRLNDRPQQMATARSYFTIVASSTTEPEARTQFERLRSSFPFEAFALYPPNTDQRNWTIVLASYVSHVRATQTAALARAIAITLTPAIWKIPDNVDIGDWRPIASGPLDEPNVRQPDRKVAGPNRRSLDQVATAKKVLSCYNERATNNETVTVEQMFYCSGVWLTPKALLRCALGQQCPAYPDTVSGRAALDSALVARGLNRTSALMLSEVDIPAMPAKADIERCNAAASSQGAFTDCVMPTIGADKKPLIDCFSKKTEGERLLCFTDKVNDPNLALQVGCAIRGTPSAESVLACNPSAEIKAKADKIRDCVKQAGGYATAAGCVTADLPDAQKKLAECLTKTNSATGSADCLGNLSPDYAKAKQLFDCMSSGGKGTWTNCAATAAGGDAARAANCVGDGSKSSTDVALCLLGDKPEVRTAQHVRTCISSGRSASSLIANCADGILDAKTSQVLSCVSNANGDKAQLAGCAAGAVLPPDAARVVSCATTSSGATSFALCAAGPAMNEEWRIAAECAVETGGNPIGFAGCTATQLTINELTKCFKGSIGTSCFGQNNTIVLTLTNAFNDLTKGPGPNNEIVKAIRAVGEITGGPNSVINNPRQLLGGSSSMINNPSQIWGGDNSVFNQIAGGSNSEFRKVLGAFDPSSW